MNMLLRSPQNVPLSVAGRVHVHHGAPSSFSARQPSVYRGIDLYVFGVLAVVLFQVGKLRFSPIALQTLLPVISVVAYPRLAGVGLNGCLRAPAFLFLIPILLIDALFGDTAVTFVLRFGLIGTVGRMVSQFCLLFFLVGYINSQKSGLIRVLSAMFALMAVSEIWYLAEVFVGSPFVEWRGYLYHDVYLLEAFRENVSTQTIAKEFRSGLSPFLHVFGYTACAAVASALSQVLLRSTPGFQTDWRRVWGRLLLGSLAMSLSLQRSALIGSVTAGLLCIVLGKGRKNAVATVLAVGLIAAALYPVIVFTRSGISSVSMSEKITAGRDVSFRLRLQVIGLYNIATHPLGLRAAGTAWSEAGTAVAATKANVVVTERIGVHNAYLAYALEYGWFGLFLVIMFLYHTWRMILEVFRDKQASERFGNAPAVIAATVFALVFVQASLHHASILSREPASVLFFGMLAALFSSRFCRSSAPVG